MKGSPGHEIGRSGRSCGPLPGTELNAHMELPLPGKTLVGISFRGLDTNRSFVEVVASVEMLSAAVDTAALRSSVADSFAMFARSTLARSQTRLSD